MATSVANKTRDELAFEHATLLISQGVSGDDLIPAVTKFLEALAEKDSKLVPIVSPKKSAYSQPETKEAVVISISYISYILFLLSL